jgi:hypothetical protein
MRVTQKQNSLHASRLFPAILSLSCCVVCCVLCVVSCVLWSLFSSLASVVAYFYLSCLVSSRTRLIARVAHFSCLSLQLNRSKIREILKKLPEDIKTQDLPPGDLKTQDAPNTTQPRTNHQNHSLPTVSVFEATDAWF